MNQIMNSHRALRLFLPALTLFNLILAACSTAATPTPELIATPESSNASATPEPTDAPTLTPLVAETPGPSPTVTPPPYNPNARPVAPTDIFFTRRAPESVTLFNQTFELWAIAPDGTGEQLVTSFNPVDQGPTFPTESPDSRFVAFSDTPGLVVLDKQTDDKIVVAGQGDDGRVVRYFVWSADSAGLYYVLDGDALDDHSVYYQSFPPDGDPRLILDSPMASIAIGTSTSDIPEIPKIALRDGRLILRTIAYELPSWDTTVYDPTTGSHTPVTGPFGYIRIDDVAPDDTLVFYAVNAPGDFCPCDYFTGRLDLSGEIIDIHPIPRTDWFLDLQFLPDGRLIGHTRSSGEGFALHLLTQDPDGIWLTDELMRVSEDDYDVQVITSVLDESTVILERWANDARTLWRYPLYGEPKLIATIFPHDS